MLITRLTRRVGFSEKSWDCTSRGEVRCIIWHFVSAVEIIIRSYICWCRILRNILRVWNFRRNWNERTSWMLSSRKTKNNWMSSNLHHDHCDRACGRADGKKNATRFRNSASLNTPKLCVGVFQTFHGISNVIYTQPQCINLLYFILFLLFIMNSESLNSKWTQREWDFTFGSRVTQL